MTALSIAKKRAAEAEANRLAMPEISRYVRLANDTFGPAKVTFASEGGITKGTVTQDGYEVTARDMVLHVGKVLVDWDNPAAHRAALAEIERGRE